MILDASVGIEIAIGSAIGERALHLIDEDIYAPELFISEVHHVLKKMLNMRRLSARNADRAALRIEEFPISYFPISRMQADLWRFAKSVSSYDAQYVSLAHSLQLPLMTRDARLARFRNSGVKFVLVN